ncbi:sensor histidine kinase [Verrucomicrobiota bacterium sgz303538]
MNSLSPEDYLAELADHLCKHQAGIISEWLVRVQNDQQIPASDRISPLQLRDHLPELLEELAALLIKPDSVRAANQADATARVHGSCRWQQGYDLAEVLKELAQFRTVLMHCLHEFEVKQPGFAGKAKSTALSRLHFLLDDLIAASVNQFVSQQEGRLRQSLAELSAESESRLRLLRTVSHEVRNVLNAVSVAAEALPEEDDDTLRAQFAMIILRNVRHMRDLLDQLLDLSTLIAEQRYLAPVRFDPAALLREIVLGYKSLAERKGLQLQTVSDPQLGAVELDELKVKQIASNLTSNAIKYTDSGWVRVEFRAVDDQRWMICVEDTGVGMTQAECDRIFNEFYRVQRTAHVQGLGLGLAITKRLVDMLGATVQVSSQLGRGSRFEVVLPRMARLVPSAPALVKDARSSE